MQALAVILIILGHGPDGSVHAMQAGTYSSVDACRVAWETARSMAAMNGSDLNSLRGVCYVSPWPAAPGT